MDRSGKSGFIPVVVFAAILLASVLSPPPGWASSIIKSAASQASSAEKKEAESPKPDKSVQQAPETNEVQGPLDPLGREAPRGAVQGFMKAGRASDMDRALEYFDLRSFPWLDEGGAKKIAEKFYIVLRRGLWLDPKKISGKRQGNLKDGLPEHVERVGVFQLPESKVEVILERQLDEDGNQVWKFAGSNVYLVPQLYEKYGLGQLGEWLDKIFPSVEILGLFVWQWVGMAALIALSYLAAMGITSVARIWLVRSRPSISEEAQKFVTGPFRFFCFVLIGSRAADLLSLPVEVQVVSQARTLLVIAVAWLLISLTSVFHARIQRTLNGTGREGMTPILGLFETVLKILVVITAILIWLDNVGFKVTTILTSLGVGGIAVALAAQDTLKNFFGSLIILADKPFKVGERIVVKGNDGIVEEIGLRSTKLRLLDGNQAAFPNEMMTREHIVNIGRRPHIRRIANIGIARETPREKVKQAVDAVRSILENHEGMEADFPPRIYFNDLEDSAFNIIIYYWYHPADWWQYLEFTQGVNLAVLEAFDKLGVRLAYPTRKALLSGDPDNGLPVNISKGDISEVVK